MSQLVTADAVLLDLRPAQVPTRMLGVFIDLTIMFVASYVFGYLIYTIGGSPARVRAVTAAGTIVVLFGYPITMETLTRGRTVGHFALGLRVVRDDGGSIRFRHALLRALAFWTLDFALWTGFCGGLVCASVNPQSKRFGDLLAGTIVIRTRAPRPPQPLAAVPGELTGWTAQLELSRLSDEVVTASRHLVQRFGELGGYPRTQLATDLARQVAAQTAPPAPVPLAPEVFLAAVVAERRQRETNRLYGQRAAPIHSDRWVPAVDELPAGWR